MSKSRILTTMFIVALVPALAMAAPPQFRSGNFGSLGNTHMSDQALATAAAGALQGILVDHFGGNGREHMVPGLVFRDELGAAHVRFTQEINGMPLEGAGFVLHIDGGGNIFGGNGGFANNDVALNPSVDASTALDFALGQAGIAGARNGADLAYVYSNGNAHLAWKTTVDYVNESGPQRDVVYASALTGELISRAPQIHYAMHLMTYDCHQKTKNCTLVAETPPDVIPINTGDAAIDAAHNFAAGTYDYYWNNHGRDSIDDNGMTIISRVHYDRRYNNAFWDGTQMTYGDGDGTTFIPLSQDADVVAHELTHGVTEYSSGLVYQDEPGALNEALSDIFGAMVDAQYGGATGLDIWKVGEDIYTPGTPGDALRYMYDPELGGDYDWWPTRYTGTSDNGGVHWNSGIANLAFYLLSEGGTHPRGKSSVVVTGIGMQNAADIFYAANTGCLTSGANFAEARYCTADVFGGASAANVHDAWDAVGVPNDPPPPPPDPIQIADGVPETGVALSTGQVQDYYMDVVQYDQVACSTSCNNGDADLYLRFGAPAETNPNSTNNECGSYSSTSNESCSTGAASSATTFWAAVHAYAGFSNLTLVCDVTNNGACGAPGEPCSSDADCCNGCSGGKPGTRTCN